jgi:hypothetical protein
MLYGNNEEEAMFLVREALRASAYCAWDVVKVSEANTAAKETLNYFIEVALSGWKLPFVASPYPLHGTITPAKVAAELIPAVVEAYSAPVLARKQKMLVAVFKAQLGLLFNRVPKNKADLKHKYPELFPVIRRRRKP